MTVDGKGQSIPRADKTHVYLPGHLPSWPPAFLVTCLPGHLPASPSICLYYLHRSEFMIKFIFYVSYDLSRAEIFQVDPL